MSSDSVSKRFNEFFTIIEGNRRGTQARMATRLGCSKALISHWRSGRTKPNKSSELKLTEIYGLNPEWLFHGEGEMLITPKELQSPSISPEYLQLLQNRDDLLNLVKLLTETSPEKLADNFGEAVRLAKIITNNTH